MGLGVSRYAQLAAAIKGGVKKRGDIVVLVVKD